MLRGKLLEIAVGLAIGLSTVSASAQEIVVGGKGFTEQLIMAEMTAQLLKANGLKPDKRVGMGSAVVRQALESGQVDLYGDIRALPSASTTRSRNRSAPRRATRRSGSSMPRRDSSGSSP